MARPRKEGMDYFPHDVHLSDDKKVIALRTLHGNDGYAFYGIMLECIYQEPNFELEVSDAETRQILARKVEVTPIKFDEMLKTAIKHRCFDQERYENDGVLTSNGIKKRASVVVEKRVTMRDKYISGVVSDAEIGVESTQSKSKRKVKEIVKALEDTVDANASKRFIKPSIQQVIEYCQERNNGVDANKWYDFYESKGWKVGSNSMKDWKAAVRTWEKSSTPSISRTGTSYANKMNDTPKKFIEKEVEVYRGRNSGENDN